jgi:riboflavin synthase
VGDELGGHFMLGHVDGVAQVLEREDLTDSVRIAFRAPADLSRFIATKGSVALDGVSLTVNDVRDSTFSVTVIPHTLQITTFGSLHAGDPVNIEVDTMARYAARLADARQ